jgi:hypothetical protein
MYVCMYVCRSLLGLLTLFIMLITPCYAQPDIEWDSECTVANDGDCTAWSAENTRTVNLEAPDCMATVKYKLRSCTKNGVTSTDIVIVSWTLTQGCEGWDTKSLYHMKYDGLKEYVKLGLISQMNFQQSPNCDGSNGAPLNIANVYTAACGVWT